MTLSQIEILVELAVEKSFSRVARKLGITQPAVSHAIRKLETELDTLIVSRQNKSFELSPQGVNILIHCQEIIKQTKNIRNEVLSNKIGTREKLILGTVWSINNTILPKIINSFKRGHANIDISIFEGTDEEIDHWLNDKTIDIGISGWKASGFENEKLAEDGYTVVVSKRHRLAGKKIIEVSELRNYPMISSRMGCGPLIESIAQYHNVKFQLRYDAREILTILSMVREDLGISIFPELAIPKKSFDVKFIPLNTPVKRNIYISHRAGQGSSAVTELFIIHALKRDIAID